MKLQLLTLLLSAAPLLAQQPAPRPPSTPLVTHNPYFSIWSDTDNLTDSSTVHWTGKPQPLAGLLRVDGKTMRFMGREPRDLPAMEQTSHIVTPTHTRYSFTGGGVELDLTFFTPTILSDLDILSRPVTYVSFALKSADGKTHQDASVLFDVGPIIAVNAPGEAVTYSRNQTETQTVLSVGSREQRILNRSGDDLRIDWGYFHLSVPKNESSASAIVRETSVSSNGAFATTGKLPIADDMDASPVVGHGDAHLATELFFNTLADQPVTQHLLVSYTEGYAIQYLERNLRPWWQRNGQTVAEMLDAAERELPASNSAAMTSTPRSPPTSPAPEAPTTPTYASSPTARPGPPTASSPTSTANPSSSARKTSPTAPSARWTSSTPPRPCFSSSTRSARSRAPPPDGVHRAA